MWQALWFYLPACVVPLALYLLWVFYGQECVLPLDLGHKNRDQPLIGASRGLWGLPAAILFGGLCGAAQGRGFEAVVLAVGADFGCIFHSFLKRRAGMPRGSWNPPWDHIDFVLGASLFYALQYGLSLELFLTGTLVCGLTHLMAHRLIRGMLSRHEPGVR